MAFVPSQYSYADAAADTSSTSSSSSWLDKAKDLITGGGSSSGIAAWATLIDAIKDPRERVAELEARIRNYQSMRAKYGIGPVYDLYTNQIRLMKARLTAEKTNLQREQAGEASTDTWRTIGHALGYVAIGVGVLGGGWILVRTVRS